ncbi:MAG TPA: riboflavin synthase [Candidatus Binatia bacterium]
MFTGLVEDVGNIESVQQTGTSAVFTISTHLPLREMKLGASIAVNGACLTITKKRGRSFSVDVSSETLDRTNLSRLKRGALVNLEQPMRLQDRLGGHLVTGHIDGVGTLAAMRKDGEFTLLEFQVPARLGSLFVEKGSVAVDGISLTVNQCNSKGFSVVIIPSTLQHTNLRGRRVGDNVNIETDLIGKYVRSFLDKQRR